jgi:WD40 repeat protein
MKKVGKFTSGTIGIGNITFTNDGEKLLAANLNDSIHIWDINLARVTKQLVIPNSLISTFALSNDGEILVTSGNTPSIVVWDMSSQKPLFNIAASSGRILDIALSPDKQYLARANFSQRTTELWNLDSKQIMQTYEFGYIGFHPILEEFILVNPKSFIIVQLTKNFINKEFGLKEEAIHRFSISRNGSQLAMINSAGDVLIWDYDLQKFTNTIFMKGDDAVTIKFSPTNSLIAIASTNSVISVFDTNTWQEVSKDYADLDHCNNIAFSPNGLSLAVSGGGRSGGFIQIWNINMS